MRGERNGAGEGGTVKGRWLALPSKLGNENNFEMKLEWLYDDNPTEKKSIVRVESMVQGGAVNLKSTQGGSLHEGSDFLPSERSSEKEITELAEVWLNNPLLSEMLKNFGALIFIVNKRREIVASNFAFLAFVNGDIKEIVGLRPGEVLHCVHHNDNPEGCGTSAACRTCGFAIALSLADIADRPKTPMECYLSYKVGSITASDEFAVDVSPLSIGNTPFYLATLQSISERKRNALYERRFFHDLRNSVATTAMAAEAIAMEPTGDNDGMLQTIISKAGTSLRIIERFRTVTSVEKNLYKSFEKSFSLKEMWNGILSRFSRDAIGKRQVICNDLDKNMRSDSVVLSIVLEVAFENALDFSPVNSTITLSSRRENNEIVVSIHNEGAIPELASQRIFERYYTTKSGECYGMGTYIMRLLTERALRGTVRFESSERTGTTFYVHVPLKT